MPQHEMLTLVFWNKLAASHLTEVVLTTTVALVIVLDRYLRRLVNKFTSSNKALRFVVFLLVCSVGYAALAIGVNWVVKTGLTLHKGEYMAPIVFGILLIASLEALRAPEA